MAAIDGGSQRGYVSLGTTEPIYLPIDKQTNEAVPGESYFCVSIHSAQAAFTGPFWMKALQLVVTSQVELGYSLLGEEPCKAIQRMRRVERNRAIKLGLRPNLINWVPAAMDHISVSIDFRVDTENRLAQLASLINDDAFVATVSLAPGAAAVAKTISGLSEKVLHTFMMGESREPILQFSGDFNIAGGGLREGYYIILGTYDKDCPIKRPLPILSLQEGDLLANGDPVDNWSYVVLQVRVIQARTRALSNSAPWDTKLRSAEASAQRMAGNPLVDDSERHRTWEEVLKSLHEAQILLLSDPNYLGREANDIIRQAYASCYSYTFGPETQGRQRLSQKEGGFGIDKMSDRLVLGIGVDEDIEAQVSQYVKKVEDSVQVISEVGLSK